jgi:hypothetical protein
MTMWRVVSDVVGIKTSNLPALLFLACLDTPVLPIDYCLAKARHPLLPMLSGFHFNHTVSTHLCHPSGHAGAVLSVAGIMRQPSQVKAKCWRCSAFLVIVTWRHFFRGTAKFYVARMMLLRIFLMRCC